MSPPKASQAHKKKGIAELYKAKDDCTTTIGADGKTSVPAFPLASLLWPARSTTSPGVVIGLVLLAVGLYRWCVGLWGYSGFKTPPMHGDYEAQRHWMEITTGLPTSQWYFYDLQYWGLDYPPLTAYHSWAIGKIGSLIDPSWFALDSSRGNEDPTLKIFMRASVLVSEYLLYIPAVIIFNRQLSKIGASSQLETLTAVTAVLMQPATILIDHAHFQYNTVMLGAVLASMSSIFSHKYLLAAAFFVAALSFKQMALYYAPAIFFYLIGICIAPKVRPGRFIMIAVTTISCFSLVVLPLSIGALYDRQQGVHPPLTIKDRQVNPMLQTISAHVKIDVRAAYYPILLQVTQMIHRIFPFARGLFEDKVANVWCSIHTIHKLHLYPIPLLQRISLLTTLVAIQPACMLISLFPRRELLPWAMASCAWGFFLFSFQVHEKSVLLPLLPMTMLLSSGGGLDVSMRSWIGLANMLGVWTLYPLLQRDELRVPYTVLSGLWAYLLALPPTSLSCYFGPRAAKSGTTVSTTILHLAFYTAMVLWHGFEIFVAPPTNKPDFYAVVNVLIGTAGFGLCYLWCTWQLILKSDVMQEWFGYRSSQDTKARRDQAQPLPIDWYFKKSNVTSASDTTSGNGHGDTPASGNVKKKLGRPRLEVRDGGSKSPSPSPEKRKPGRPKKST